MRDVTCARVPDKANKVTFNSDVLPLGLKKSPRIEWNWVGLAQPITTLQHFHHNSEINIILKNLCFL